MEIKAACYAIYLLYKQRGDKGYLPIFGYLHSHRRRLVNERQSSDFDAGVGQLHRELIYLHRIVSTRRSHRWKQYIVKFMKVIAIHFIYFTVFKSEPWLTQGSENEKSNENYQNKIDWRIGIVKGLTDWRLQNSNFNHQTSASD